MKKSILTVVLILSIFACKKDKKEEVIEEIIEEPTNYLNATVNGSSFSSDTYFSGVNGDSYFITGQTGLALGAPSIRLAGKIKLGKSTITGTLTSPFQPYYYNDSKDYKGIKGTIDVSTFDTLNKSIKKFVATFDFQTDTVGGKSYKIASGSVYFEN